MKYVRKVSWSYVPYLIWVERVGLINDIIQKVINDVDISSPRLEAGYRLVLGGRCFLPSENSERSPETGSPKDEESEHDE